MPTGWNGHKCRAAARSTASPWRASRPGPAFAADLPYVIALIDLDEGPRMMTSLVAADVDAVRIGDRVTVAFDDVSPEITLPRFSRSE